VALFLAKGARIAKREGGKGWHFAQAVRLFSDTVSFAFFAFFARFA
jgi:hypothetical protein